MATTGGSQIVAGPTFQAGKPWMFDMSWPSYAPRSAGQWPWVFVGKSSPNGPTIQVSEILFHLPRSMIYS